MTGEHRRKIPRALILVLLGIFGCVAVLLMVLSNSGLALLDKPLWGWFVENRGEPVTSILTAVTTVTEPNAMVAIGALTAVLLWWRTRSLRAPVLLLVTMLAGVGTSTLVKHLVNRIRPPADFMMLGADSSPSFPSGHTLGIAVFLLVLGYLYCSRGRVGARSLALMWVVWAFVVSLVAISRLCLGYHWLTDVCASMLLSIAFLGLVTFLDALLFRRTPRKGGKTLNA